MPPMTTRSEDKRRLPLVRGGLLLAFALVAVLWASSYFRAEARVRRATERIVKLVQKEAEEAPVSLGLSGHRLGGHLALDAALELESHGLLMTGRKEIVQFYVQVRNSFRQIEFIEPRIAVAILRAGEVRATVEARYRFTTEGGEVLDGAGQATLRWVKGEDGWQIAQATVKPDSSTSLPKDWP